MTVDEAVLGEYINDPNSVEMLTATYECDAFTFTREYWRFYINDMVNIAGLCLIRRNVVEGHVKSVEILSVVDSVFVSGDMVEFFPDGYYQIPIVDVVHIVDARNVSRITEQVS